MKKEFKGYVSRDEEYGYMGVNCTDVSDKVDDMIRGYEGRRIKITVVIEEIVDNDTDS